MRQLKTKYHRKKKSVLSLFIVFLLLLVIAPRTLNVSAATIHTIPDASLSTILNAVNIKMGKDNLTSYQWKNVRGKVVRDADGNHIFSVPIKSTTSDFSYNNVMELNFSDVMSICGRKVNATVSIDSISVNKPYWVSGEEEGYFSFMMIYSYSIWFGTDPVINLYRAEKTTKVTTVFTYDDTGEQIDAPLYQILNDIDICDKAGYEEMWQGNSGYTGDIYTFESCKLKIDQNNMKLEATTPTSGDTSYLEGGAIVPIDSAVVTQTYFAANASTGMILYSPYDDRNMPKPSKTADNQGTGGEKIYDNGQIITWDVSQKVHTCNADIFTTYTNMSFVDTLPNDMEYEDAKLYHGNKDVTSEYGTLKYDKSSHTVTYDLKSNTLNKSSFYDGGTVRLEIKTKAVNNTNEVIAVTNNAYTVTNNIKQEVDKTVTINYDVTLSVKKDWSDGNDADGVRPKNVTVKLVLDTYMGSTKLNSLDIKTVTLSDANDWSEAVKVRNPINNLLAAPPYTYIYRWEEVNIPAGYTSAQAVSGNTTTITNMHTPGKTTATVVKVWDDGSNRDVKRPEKIETELLANGEKTGRKVTLNEKNNWTASINDLDQKVGGKVIIYSWREVTIPEGYESSIKVNGTTTTITNKYNPETVTVTGIKVWEDNNNQDGIRPDGIDVTLLADGENVKTFVLNKDNDWRAEYTGFKYKEGKEIKYTWKEKPVAGYASTQAVSGNTTTITNTHIPEKVSVNVTKTWQDENDADGIRPDSVDVILKANGTKVGNYKITKDKGWQLTVNNLNKYADGKEIIYTWDEASVAGYASQVKTEGYNTVITNSYTPMYKIITSIDEGTITENKSGIKRGESHTVSWNPSHGRYVDSVIIDEKEISNTEGSYTFTNITSDHEVVVKTLPYYVITTEIDNGLITERIEKIKGRESKVVSWTPDAGYYVSAVKIDGKTIYEGTTLDYPTSHEFSDINTDYDIQVETKLIPNLVITKNADKDVYNVDDEITYTIQAKQIVEGAVATNVIITDKDKTKGLDFDLDTVKCSDETAKIKKDNGTFTVSLDELAYGKTVVITVKGKVTKAELESSDIKNIATIGSAQTEEGSADKNIEINYNIITAVENGTIDDSVFDLKNGKNETINFKPNDGYYLDEVKVDGEVLEISDEMDSYEFTDIKDNHLIEVKYAPYYKVTGKIDYGTITEDKTDIKKGENHTVTWTPENGRYVTKVTVNGEIFYEGTTLDYPTEYAFTNIENDSEVIVETAPIPEETTQPEEPTQQVVTDPEETTTEETTVEETSDKIVEEAPQEPSNAYTSPKTGGKTFNILSVIYLLMLFPGIVIMLLAKKKLNKNN